MNYARDHVVSLRTDSSSLVPFDGHVELDGSVGQLKRKLQRIREIWLGYPVLVGSRIGDFNSVEPDEERFNIISQCFLRWRHSSLSSGP